MNLKETIQANQKRIKDLTVSIGLWSNTPHAQKKEVRAKIQEAEDRMLFRLQELEVQGQEVKIENMEAVLRLLKDGV